MEIFRGINITRQVVFLQKGSKYARLCLPSAYLFFGWLDLNAFHLPFIVGFLERFGYNNC